jgi:hypothetical protein
MSKNPIYFRLQVIGSNNFYKFTIIKFELIWIPEIVIVASLNDQHTKKGI